MICNKDIARIRAKYGVSEEQAREILDKGGPDESGIEEAARNLVHFLKAPS